MKLLLDLPRVPIAGPRPMAKVAPILNYLRFLADPVAGMLRLHRDYGDLVAVCDRRADLVCAFGAAYNRRILADAAGFTNNEEPLFPLPPESAMRRLLRQLPLLNGPAHRRNRRLMLPALHKARIDAYRDDMAELTDRALARWVPGSTLDMTGEMIDLTLRIAHKCLFGLDVGGSAAALGELSIRILDGLTSVGAMILPRDAPGTPYRALLRAGDRLDAEMRALIRRKREQPESARDVLSALIQARDEEDGSLLSDDELVAEANGLFIAGHETAASTLLWTLFLLSQHPRVAEDLRDELRGALRGDPPTAAALGELPLLDAVIKESMRILPATPMLFMRIASRPFELSSIEMPAGTRVVLSPLITHRNAEIYPEPARFVPERWRALSPSIYEYMPFGAGPRMCVGASFASLEIRAVLATVLQRFRPQLAPGSTIARKARGITMGLKHGMPMIIKPIDHVYRSSALRGDLHELVEWS